MNEYLVKALKEGRASKGLKQSEVAELVGVKPNTLSNYENGVSEPDIDTFANLCEIYDLDFSYVLGEAYGLGVIGADFDIKPSELEIIKKHRDLDEHGKEMFDFTLQKEWERSTQPMEGQLSAFPIDGYLKIWHNGKWEKYQKGDEEAPELNAAHTRTDIEIPTDTDTTDNDIMNSEDF